MSFNYDTSSPYVILAGVLLSAGVVFILVSMSLAVAWDVVGIWQELSGRKKRKSIKAFIEQHQYEFEGSSMEHAGSRVGGTSGKGSGAMGYDGLPEFRVVSQDLDEKSETSGVNSGLETPFTRMEEVTRAGKSVHFGKEERREEDILTGVLEDVEALEGTSLLEGHALHEEEEADSVDGEGVVMTSLLDEWGTEGVSETVSPVEPNSLYVPETLGVPHTPTMDEGEISTSMLENILEEAGVPTGLLYNDVVDQGQETTNGYDLETPEADLETGVLGEDNMVDDGEGESEVPTSLLSVDEDELNDSSEGAINTGILDEPHEKEKWGTEDEEITESAVMTSLIEQNLSWNDKEGNITTGVLTLEELESASESQGNTESNPWDGVLGELNGGEGSSYNPVEWGTEEESISTGLLEEWGSDGVGGTTEVDEVNNYLHSDTRSLTDEERTRLIMEALESAGNPDPLTSGILPTVRDSQNR